LPAIWANCATLRSQSEPDLPLAFDGAKLPGGVGGGVLTPATALGETFVPRLKRAGFGVRVGWD
jgi:short subunit dehydrogenase-like uncharacterized protein